MKIHKKALKSEKAWITFRHFQCLWNVAHKVLITVIGKVRISFSKVLIDLAAQR